MMMVEWLSVSHVQWLMGASRRCISLRLLGETVCKQELLIKYETFMFVAFI